MSIERRASVVVCDDVLVAMNGKVFLNGVYTSDIAVPAEGLTVGQLVFYFTAETPKDNPFQKITLKVTPPGAVPAVLDIPLENLPPLSNPERPKMFVRAPILLQQIQLRPGKIETTVLTEAGEELDAGGVWVSVLQPRLQGLSA
ncbi:hypothetical protein AYJ54_07875 [Bradyrhizobium centrolobii]|uniref:Uncharacterized protein n=1 Tax=Bradyrhizobium centrolobii TaxID=1505087 RepID=A0A176YVM8_9BRAD|nr:hypothetical protein [Bradyrhizobium centrolobii]OAF11769.1 hypothetical protein AYJ54_07875 [Bradyrhizobium centrolobii]